MKPKSIILTGDVFLLIGIWLSIFLIYQAVDCFDANCFYLFVSLASSLLLISIIAFIVLMLFGMGMLRKVKRLQSAY